MSSNNNFTVYRAALHTCHPPCIPYLGIPPYSSFLLTSSYLALLHVLFIYFFVGVFLTDLTFIEDGTKDTLNGRDDLIHFEKRRKVSVVIRDIQQYQQTPYHFSLEPTIKEALITLQSSDENVCSPSYFTSPSLPSSSPLPFSLLLSLPIFLPLSLSLSFFLSFF